MADRNYRCLSQEALKLIACITMLLDHFAHTIFPHLQHPCVEALFYTFRIIGRIALPLYAFLLVQGMRHTRNPGNYFLRLGIGALLAEIPYDLILRGSFQWKHQSVMVMLLLGAVMLWCMKKTQTPFLKMLLILLFSLAAELLRAEYGAGGILMIATFDLFDQWILQAVMLFLVSWQLIPSGYVEIFGIVVRLQLLATVAILPISLYNGKKCSRSPALQWAFYLFYPAHMLLLWALQRVIL